MDNGRLGVTGTHVINPVEEGYRNVTEHVITLHLNSKVKTVRERNMKGNVATLRRSVTVSEILLYLW